MSILNRMFGIKLTPLQTRFVVEALKSYRKNYNSESEFIPHLDETLARFEKLYKRYTDESQSSASSPSSTENRQSAPSARNEK